jgi:lincosamide and streptogramin A transport system ATP-binding/permease protein
MQNEKLEREISRLEDAASRTKKWADKAEASKIGHDPKLREKKSGGWRAYAGEKSRKLQKRRKNLERRQAEAIEQKSSLLRDVEEREELELLSAALSLRPAGRAARTFQNRLRQRRNLLADLSFTFITRGDRIALRGSNGTGKSSIIKLDFGRNHPHTGEVFT